MSRRIVIFSPSYATGGGVETIIHDLCRALPQRGWSPILALAQGASFNCVARYRDLYPDLPIFAVDGTKGTRQARLEALTNTIKTLSPDIVLSFRLFDAYFAAALEKQRRKKLRLAIAIRAYEPQYLFDARLFNSNIDLCVVDGDLLAAAAKEISLLPAERVVSIPGGIRTPSNYVQTRTASDHLRLGYVGRLAQSDKRVLDVVELVARLDETGKPFLLSIVGAGPEEDVLRKLLARFIQVGVVKIMGWKTPDQLYSEIYPNLDCLLHFSAAEGVTISPREAMAHGVVPVISEFIGLKSERLFKHGENSLVFPVGDISTAVQHIRSLVDEPGLWSRLSANARKSQNGKYSFNGAMDLWVESLNRCADCSPMIGAAPNVPMHDEGRLAQLGLSPRWAQRIRDVFRIRPAKAGPGDEWPTGSGLMTSSDASRIMQFAKNLENSGRGHRATDRP